MRNDASVVGVIYDGYCCVYTVLQYTGVILMVWTSVTESLFYLLRIRHAYYVPSNILYRQRFGADYGSTNNFKPQLYRDFKYKRRAS